MIRAVMLYTSNDQHSHAIEGTIAYNSFSEVESISFRETPAPHTYDWHNAPRKQFVITLSGRIRFTTSSGEEFVLQAGDVLLATDITGKGHKWVLEGSEPWRRAYIILRKDTIDYFIPNR